MTDMKTSGLLQFHNNLDELLEETFGHNDWDVIVERTPEGTIRIEIEELTAGHLDKEAWGKLENILENPPEPTQELKELLND